MRVSLIGSGNVATHLSNALFNAGHQIVEVFSRNYKNASYLANFYGANPIQDLNQLSSLTDIIIVSVSDDAILTVLSKLSLNDVLIVHTAGSVSIDVFENRAINYGIFYPLQTFSKKTSVDFKTIPIIIEANNSFTLNKLQKLAQSISTSCHIFDSNKRKLLHIAAVFACNFTNHLYAIADDFLEKNDLSFDILKPLIEATASKIKNHAPKNIQTGPAVRNDSTVITEHLKTLQNYPDVKFIYETLSNDIVKMYHR